MWDNILIKSMKPIKQILIVGGGSAGWMTAMTLAKLFPNKKIKLIESPNIKTVELVKALLVV